MQLYFIKMATVFVPGILHARIYYRGIPMTPPPLPVGASPLPRDFSPPKKRMLFFLPSQIAGRIRAGPRLNMSAPSLRVVCLSPSLVCRRWVPRCVGGECGVLLCVFNMGFFSLGVRVREEIGREWRWHRSAEGRGLSGTL